MSPGPERGLALFSPDAVDCAFMQYTVLGAQGFIGSHVVQRLQSLEIPHQAVTYDVLQHLDQDLGHVLYCIGLTADFRERPFDTVEAHVNVLSQILHHGKFQSLTYLSSTRVYQGSSVTRETEPLMLNVLDPGDLFNASKLMGESLCLWGKRENVKIARVSNVVGPGRDHNVFLDQVLYEAFSKGEVVFQTAPASSKDFIHVGDVVTGLLHIAIEGRQSIYNLAAGVNASNQWIADFLSANFNIRSSYAPQARQWSFAPIDISRLKTEFGFDPRPLPDYLHGYITDFKKRNFS
jgi:nucleoside-diphosphate-sugar epimerase